MTVPQLEKHQLCVRACTSLGAPASVPPKVSTMLFCDVTVRDYLKQNLPPAVLVSNPICSGDFIQKEMKHE